MGYNSHMSKSDVKDIEGLLDAYAAEVEVSTLTWNKVAVESARVEIIKLVQDMRNRVDKIRLVLTNNAIGYSHDEYSNGYKTGYNAALSKIEAALEDEEI